MINRKNKKRLIQLILLFIGTLIVFFTYFNDKNLQEKIISSTDIKNIKKTEMKLLKSQITFIIKISGLDLQGNRYVLTSKEAQVDKNLQEIVNMNFVNAIFYFKDNTTLLLILTKVYTIIKV